MKRPKCSDCGKPAKVYDWLTKTWWCARDWKQIFLKDYRDCNPPPPKRAA